MKDEGKSKPTLLNDLKKLRNRLADCEAALAEAEKTLGNREETLCQVREGLDRPLRQRTAEMHKVSSLQDELAQTVALLRSALEATADGILVVDRKRRIVAFNQRFLDICPLPEDIAASGDGEKAVDFVSSQMKNPQEFIQRIRELYSRPEVESFDVLEFADGRVYERYSRPQTVGEKIVGRVWSFRDVTERKRAEELLRASEERFRTVADFTYDWEYWANPGSEFLYMSPSCQRITGYSVLEFLNDPGLIKKIVHADDLHMVSAHFDEVKRNDRSTGHSLDFRIIHRNGEVRWINHACRPVYGAKGHSLGRRVCNRDITDRKLAERTLAESEAKYRAVFDNAVIGIALIDADGRFREVNPALAQMLGYTQEELRSLSASDVTHPDDLEISRQHFDSFLQGGRDTYRLEKRYVRQDGTDFWADLSVSTIHNGIGDHVAAIKVVTDITRRKHSELAQRRLTTAVEQAAEAIIVTDTQGNIEYVNPACEVITGYSRDELLGSNPSIFKSGQHDSRFYQKLWNTINSGAVWRGRFVNRKKDGSLYHEETTISPVRDLGGAIANFVAVKRDISEHLALSQQLLQAQKMEAIGTLAGGIAHDFNNLLQVTMGYSEMLLMGKDKADSDYSDLQRMMQAARNGAELVRSLLTFSRKVEPKPMSVNLNSQIRQVEKLLRRTIPKMIEIRLDLTEDIGDIQADPTQIEQILMNMAVNARDAMPDGGLLTIATARRTLGEDDRRVHVGAKPGDYVLVTISDSGHGMDKSTLQHIFEPFYTTKEVGRGTGLGLAMVYGIVKQHDGYVECESEPGRGTTFNIFFPAQEPAARFDPEKSAEMPAFGTETVLLVDDEEFVRDFGKRVLSRAGYTVLTAANGKDALDLYKDCANGISLVILDLIMPEMGGAQCIEEILRINPRARVLIASGYSPDRPSHESMTGKAAGFIIKPFNIKELLRQVRKALDEKIAQDVTV